MWMVGGRTCAPTPLLAASFTSKIGIGAAAPEATRHGDVEGKVMFEHRDGFMETLRSGAEMRRRIFESLEQRYGQDFAGGAVGRTLYATLHSAVADADVPGALAEFESRFLPLVNGRRLPNQAEADSEEADEDA